MTTTVEPPEAAPEPAVAAARAAALPTAGVEPGLDRPVRLIGARLWLGAVALALAVGAGVAWGVAGSLPHTLSLPGVLAHGPAPDVLRATAPGSVAEVLVAPGARVTTGQPVALLSTGGGTRTTPLAATADGVVTAVLAQPGEPVTAGTGVVAEDPADAPDQVRLYTADQTRLARLRLGQQASVVLPDGTQLRLRIESVDPYPVAADTLAGTLPVPLPGLPGGTTPVWTVHAALELPPSAPDPAAAGPAAVTASVNLGARHPYQVLFGTTGGSR